MRSSSELDAELCHRTAQTGRLFKWQLLYSALALQNTSTTVLITFNNSNMLLKCMRVFLFPFS